MSETATPAAPATPAPSAPASSGASTQTATPSRPTSFGDSRLDWSDAPASPASTPASPETPTATPAEATPPPAEGLDTQTTPAPGPIPLDRHKAILDKAYQERDEFKTKYTALEQQFNGPDGQRLRSWATAYQQNPEAWFANTVAELAAANPNLVPALRSQAARLLSSRTPAATESFEPDIPVFDETGKQVNATFSAPKVQALIEQAVAKALQQEVGPIKQDFQQRKQQQEAAALQKEVLTTATAQFERFKDKPGFFVDAAKKTVDPDLVKAFNEHPDWSLADCYNEIVVPKLLAQRDAKTLESLQTKAAAATGVSPGSAVASTGSRPRDFNDSRLSW